MDQLHSRPRRIIRTPMGLALGLVVACVLMAVRAPAQEPPGWSRPIQSGFFKNGEIVESSGIVASRANPGIYWTHNDSDNDLILFGIDETGKDVARFLLDARMEDWEDIACAKIDGKNYLIVADVGDNGAKRKYCKLHIFIEPVIAPPGGGNGAEPKANPPAPHDAAGASDKRPERDGEAKKPAEKAPEQGDHPAEKHDERPHDDKKAQEPKLVKLKPVWTIRYKYETGPVDCEAVAIDVEARKIILISKVYGDRCAAFELDFKIPMPPADRRQNPEKPAKPEQPENPEKSNPPAASPPEIPAKDSQVVNRPDPQEAEHEHADDRPPHKHPEPKIEILEARKITNFSAVVVTAADISIDSKRLLLATYAQELEFTRDEKQGWAQVLTGKPRYLPTPLRRQGEAICYSLDGKAIYWTSEGARAAIWKSTRP